MANSRVVLLTLLPKEPRDPGKFHDDIANLKIEAFDLTVKDSKDGVLVGSAEGVTVDPFYLPIDITPRQQNPPQPPRLNTAILQHFTLEAKIPEPQPPIPKFIGHPKSVATAVILVELPEGRAEFDSLDLRLVVTRNDVKIAIDQPLGFNVPVRTVGEPLPKDPLTWIGFDYNVLFNPLSKGDPTFRAGYVFVPPLPIVSSTRTPVDISADGVTPVFDSLVSAVNQVLKDDFSSTDPDPKTSLQEREKPLTPVQCLQVARELVFDRKLQPLPRPKVKALEDMYSNPDVESKDDQDRKEFEANLTAYYSQHDAEALQLADFIYAASAAIECERASITAVSAGLAFQVIGDPTTVIPPLPTRTILLTGGPITANPPQILKPTFGVPAAFFYALGSNLPTHVNAQDRLTAATVTVESALLKTLQAASDNGTIRQTESALTDTTDALLQALVVTQAARRLSALGATRGNRTSVELDADISMLVEDWLKYTGQTDDIGAFWIDLAIRHPGQYFNLLLEVIVAEKVDLKNEIITVLGVNSAQALVAITDKRWRDFWLPQKTDANDETPERRTSLLPNYTLPGSPKQRTEAFISFLKSLFSIKEVGVAPDDQAGNTVQILTRPTRDVLQVFLDSMPGFSFTVALDDNAINGVLNTLPWNAATKEWAKTSLKLISFLLAVTNFQGADQQTDNARFSMIEGLYARGFVTANRIAALSKVQFRAALAGTTAYDEAPSGVIFAHLIHDIAIGVATDMPSPGPEPGFTFSPINPGGLVDCIPVEHLSPFGRPTYLRLLLLVQILSDTSKRSIGQMASSRRGPLGDLQVSSANLEIALPLIDIANESLEALVAQTNTENQPRGVIYDTDDTAIGPLALGHEDGQLDPCKALAAIPQHSTPNFGKSPTIAYQVLKQVLSTPLLPYDQELDINRSYLSILSTTRFEVMRHAREQITEFALDPAREPANFRKQLWRFPVRLEIAIEYLKISQCEMQLFFTSVPQESDLGKIYGFTSGTTDWDDQLSCLPILLERSGLSYCEFYDLWKLEIFNIHVSLCGMSGPESSSIELQRCEPCCLKSYKIGFGSDGEQKLNLYKLAVFVRFWRKIELRYGKHSVSLTVVAAICQVLQLFINCNINKDFIRQVVALFMLCDELCLPLCERHHGPGMGSEVSLLGKVPFLSIWADSHQNNKDFREAVEELLRAIEIYARQKHRCRPRTAHFRKLLAENLDPLAKLAGFTESVPWHAKPTCTLRFVEVLAKIYASPYTIGEILFLFTNGRHLVGDDPFAYTESSESIEDPLNVAEDDQKFGLWELRGKILSAQIHEDDEAAWDWKYIRRVIHDEFGIVGGKGPGSDDPLTLLAEHLFPHVLNHCVCVSSSSSSERHFRTPLCAEDTNTTMWNSPPCGPFHFDKDKSELWMQLPLRDEDIIDQLARIRQLRSTASKGQSELQAVKELYFAPRALLAPFTPMLGSVSEVVKSLIEEPCEKKRFSYFRKRFALFHQRCKILAAHLSQHVRHVIRCNDGEEDETAKKNYDDKHDLKVAWKIIQHLVADENRGKSQPWELDSGATPDQDDFLWDPKLSGSAFAALLGVAGTGIVGKFSIQEGCDAVWEEMRGPLAAFGRTQNKNNVPVTTVIPALDVMPSAEQRLGVLVKNGLMWDEDVAEHLGGAQAFNVEWKGVLLVERSGVYKFSVDRPGCDENCCDRSWWIVKLRRGQRRWTLINNHRDDGPKAPDLHSSPIHLSHGAYEIEVVFHQTTPRDGEDDLPRHAHTGFAVQYCGPDSQDELVVIPLDKLFRKCKESPLSLGDGKPCKDNLHKFLAKQYVSSLRDIRRTYQRVFKALLFAQRFRLSADAVDWCHGQSELGFLLSHPVNFQGASYYLPGKPADAKDSSDALTRLYQTHLANFDFNLLPVKDAYCPPTREKDNRAEPSPQRSAALFDWWERIFDYRNLVDELSEREPCINPPWRLFYEAAVQEPPDARSLTPLLGIEPRLSSLVLNYYENFDVQVAHLEDERWTIRVWRLWQLVQRIRTALYSKSLHESRPSLWASTSPGVAVNGDGHSNQQSGNQNLMCYVLRSLLIDHDDPKYCTVKDINDRLRVAGNRALISYLCALGTVRLDFKTPTSSEEQFTATTPADLASLLLQDIQPGLCQEATRVGEGISCVQTLVQRISLKLEPRLELPAHFRQLWETSFESFEAFQRHMRRYLYRENWIQWEELQVARESEAFQFLENNLDVYSLAIPKTSPPFPLDTNYALSGTCELLPTQNRDSATIALQQGSPEQGIGLVAIPARSSQPSWLSSTTMQSLETPEQEPEMREGKAVKTDTESAGTLTVTTGATGPTCMPMWFQAVVKLGTKFVRVAAASIPPAIQGMIVDRQEPHTNLGCRCGKKHPPLIDEYYFWLEQGEYFNPNNAVQNADIGIAPPDLTTDWERDDRLPKMLHWPTQPLVYLQWTRIHNGEFLPPRRSAEGAAFDPGSERPELAFKGRKQDSLLFGLFGSDKKGFRYDLAPDAATVLPQATEDVFPTEPPIPEPLSAYPFFIYFRPGAPIFPVSSFASALAIAGALRSQCKFEEALAWCRLAFDPLDRDNTWAQCKPDQSPSRNDQSSDDAVSLAAMSIGAVDKSGNEDGPCCPTSPVGVGIARGRAVALEYVRILLQWGDSLLCKGSFESRRRALVLYEEAIRIIGQKPLLVRSNRRSENGCPTVAEFIPASAALNPDLMQLYDEAYDRRDLIRQCSDASRLPIKSVKLFNSTKSTTCLGDAWDSCGCGIGQGECFLPFKFQFLLSKALDLVATAKGLGQALLAAIEKGDTEHLASIRQAQERQMNELVLSTRQNGYRESDWQVQALEQQLQGALTRLRHTQQLIQNGLNSNEHAYLSATTVAMQLRVSANVSEGVGQGMNFIPDFTVGGAGVGGSPVAINQLPLGSKLAQVFQAASRILNTVADVSSTAAGVGSTQGGWDRRLEEWVHQVDVTTIEIAQLKRQQLAALRRRDVELRELNNHKVQMENSAEVDVFLRDRMCKRDLYLFMQQENAKLYRRTFGLAWETTKEAEAALRHERRDLADAVASLLPSQLGPAGWDDLRAGLMASERLEYALRSLDRLYMRRASCREYELSKHVSLRLHLPLAFLQLKLLGWCEFELPEWMFDLDYPGHYFRRIKNVSLTIPCVVGPYVGVHCRLRLLSSGLRITPVPPSDSSDRCCCKSGPACIKPWRPSAGHSQSSPPHLRPDGSICVGSYMDPEGLTRDFVSSEAIATSSGQTDGGVFELSFRDDKLRAPFEFAGAAASRWRIELPPRNNQFDLDSLTDFVLHINYTAKEGGEALREVADLAAWRRLPGDGVRFFDVRSEFPAAFSLAFGPNAVRNHGKSTHNGGGGGSKTHHVGLSHEEKDRNRHGRPLRHHGKQPNHHRSFPLQFRRRSFPFLTGKRSVHITGLDVFIEVDRPCGLGEHFSVLLKPREGCGEVRRAEGTASCDCPSFFHATFVGLDLGPLRDDSAEDWGCLDIPEPVAVAGVLKVYFLCRYKATEKECC